MNRLLLIGNGFDLAHGMKTSYKDFYVNWLIQVIEKFKNKGVYNDDDLYMSVVNKDTLARSVLKEAFRLFDGLSFKEIFSKEDIITYPVGKERIGLENTLAFDFKNEILSSCFEVYNHCGWVDIEQIFYDKLTALGKKADQDAITRLNSSLANVIRLLENYLKILPNHSYDPLIQELFNASFNPAHFTLPFNSQLNTCDNILILNFNYTQTPKDYLKHLKTDFDNKPNAYIVNIHGEIDSSHNPIVFGFGDEMDDHYKAIEKLNSNEYLTYIKTSWYLRNSNYKQLIKFLYYEEFQVSILGHSCGLSDRVMLNMIFEHPNCVSILPHHYYYDKDKTYEKSNYRNLVQNISRHFNKKSLMRDKVVEYELCTEIHQHWDV